MDRFKSHASDGRTTYYRITGKEYKGQVTEFGEYAKFHLEGKKHEKADARWEPGIFVGKSEESDQFLYLTPRGMRTARSVQRLPEKDRWNREAFDAARGTPWNPLGVATREKIVPMKEGPVTAASVVTKRHFKITEAMKQAHGKTQGCPARRTKKGMHTDACKKRFEDLYPDKLPPQSCPVNRASDFEGFQ